MVDEYLNWVKPVKNYFQAINDNKLKHFLSFHFLTCDEECKGFGFFATFPKQLTYSVNLCFWRTL